MQRELEKLCVQFEAVQIEPTLERGRVKWVVRVGALSKNVSETSVTLTSAFRENAKKSSCDTNHPSQWSLL